MCPCSASSPRGDPLMADIFSVRKRSWVMSRIKGRDTVPERVVRSFLHKHGFRFRLHLRNLPGRPDIALPKYRTVVFVNGCFWHCHKGCSNATFPATRSAFWREKILGNVARDSLNQQKLRRAGWSVLTVWECETEKPAMMLRRLRRLLALRGHEPSQ